MSVDRKLWNITLSALMLTGTACGVAVGKQSLQVEGIQTKTAKLTDTLPEKASCAKGEMTIPKPAGWAVLETQITPTFFNCYVTKQPLSSDKDFRSGFMISKLLGLSKEQDRLDYAKQLASRTDKNSLPQANTFKETAVGSFRIFSGRFTSILNNVLSDEERRIIVPTGSDFVYISRFYAPKPTSDEDFKRYGRSMLDGIMINGQPTK